MKAWPIFFIKIERIFIGTNCEESRLMCLTELSEIGFAREDMSGEKPAHAKNCDEAMQYD
ncbi:MAG: hypothetical protein NPIRA02_12410 [Nitrospirales bacterium]|nr:MAG: hypothetical protein NPIRA02_12410 [Nitrospirales bacterium]